MEMYQQQQKKKEEASYNNWQRTRVPCRCKLFRIYFFSITYKKKTFQKRKKKRREMIILQLRYEQIHTDCIQRIFLPFYCKEQRKIRGK